MPVKDESFLTFSWKWLIQVFSDPHFYVSIFISFHVSSKIGQFIFHIPTGLR